MKKRTIRNRIILGVAVVIVLLVIARKLNWIGQQDALKVSAQQVEMQNITQTVNANGKIQPETEVIITADVSGEIIELYVREGERVNEGDSLLRINPDIYQSTADRQEAALNTSKANLANAKARLAQVNAKFTNANATHKRNMKLFDQKVISQAEFDNSLSAFESAKAEVTAAEESVKAAEYSVKSAQASLKESLDNLRKTTVFAPIDGIVSSLSKETGERISGASQFSAGTEVMRISDLENMEVNVEVSESNIILVEINDTADIEVDAYPDRVFKGLVSEIANSARQTTGSSDQVTNFEVTISMLLSSYQDLRDSTGMKQFPFRPGMSANVNIRTHTVKDALAVPIRAVIAKESPAVKGESKSRKAFQSFVFKYSNQRAIMTKVQTGIQNDQYIEIQSGLAKEDEVITDPYNAIISKLQDSMLVDKVDRKQLMMFADQE
ncbi:MAG: efflux RND transporter periplasmic adaptor subunit [Bacteroidales bacterium]